MTKKNGPALRAASAARNKRTIGILGYDGVQGLDLMGPADAFTAADQYLQAGGREPGDTSWTLALAGTSYSVPERLRRSCSC